MKLSWGYKIAIAYLLFVAGILYLVFRANNEHFDLVTENYYEQELKYQDIIDQKKRVAHLSAAPVIAYKNNQLSIQFPAECAGSAVKGEVYLYRASDASQDIRQSFETNSSAYNKQFNLSLAGLYTVKLSWEWKGEQYFQEQNHFF